MRYFKNKGKRSYKKPYTRRSFNKKKYMSRTVKEVISKVKSQMKPEVKCLQLAGNLNPRAFTTASTNTEFQGAVINLVPQGATLGAYVGNYLILANGIGKDQRIGDEVKMVGTYFNYQVLALGYDATYNLVPAPQIVTLFFVKPKIGSALGLDISNIVAGANANFFENIANGDSGFTGNLQDYLRKIDRDNYNVIAIRQHKVGWSSNLTTSDTASTRPNNDFPVFVKGRVKIPSYIWKVNRQNVGQQRNIYCFAYTMRADNIAISASQIPVRVNFNLSCYYTDV